MPGPIIKWNCPAPQPFCEGRRISTLWKRKIESLAWADGEDSTARYVKRSSDSIRGDEEEIWIFGMRRRKGCRKRRSGFLDFTVVAITMGCTSLLACHGEHQGPGIPSSASLPASVLEERASAQKDFSNGSESQILFGDLHVHTTFSPDAFVMSLPLSGGEGVHPPADACDYARHCAGLDFWSINDHAEGLSPRHWRETIEAIQQCNSVSDPMNPDTVAFLGWEWSQVGSNPENHYGHKNVILRDTEDAKLPLRPIAAPRPEFRVAPLGPLARIALPLLHFSDRQRYFDYYEYQREVEETPYCEDNRDTRELPTDCHEVAHDPRELFRKLDEWGGEALVIPHGTSWGLMTPAGSHWDLQGEEGQHEPKRQNLFEIYSGHGNSEEYRPWRAVDLGVDGSPACPEPGDDGYEACCWRAGEIIRSRCDSETSADLCEERVEAARRNYLNAGVGAHNTVPGATLEDWGNCGQCPDCFLPTFSPRPLMSGQYALSRNFRFGFLASSDNHSARAGSGFKEHARLQLTESRRRPDGLLGRLTRGTDEKTAESIAVNLQDLPIQKRRYMERANFFMATGGLAAVHAKGRSREAIWDALIRREVYGTSGPRILLFFDLLNGNHGSAPMGSEVSLDASEPARFRVRASGALEERAGCPSHIETSLSPERIARLCLGECHNPGDSRKELSRIEVVRITPGMPGSIPQIEDPWRTFSCDGRDHCVVEFEDSEPAEAMRAYYVRVIQRPTPAVNGNGLGCPTDSPLDCQEIRPCTGDPDAAGGVDCLSDIEERAWSSPIFISRETLSRKESS